MRLSLRFTIPLILTLALVAYGTIPLLDALIFNKWFSRDIDIRTKLITNTLQDSIVQILENPSKEKMRKLFGRAIQDERLYALGFCDTQGVLVYKTETLPPVVKCDQKENKVLKLSDGRLHVALNSIEDGGKIYGRLILVHDMSFLEKRASETKRYVFALFAGLATVISLITVTIAQMSLRGWVKSLQAILKGEGVIRPTSQIKTPELGPIVKDLRTLLEDLEADRQFRNENQNWNSQKLKEILNKELRGDEVIIVSNREPYIHVRRNNTVEVQFPASGLVTALEPIMRACSGTWVAHGSGSADKEVVDKNDRVRVPHDKPSYQIRRVWLSEEEEKGYYYGFANEGIWPLCHMAHVRPTFRSSDWAQYVAVNKKFAKAVAQEAKTDDPIVMVQDYHLALVPKMLKEILPKSTVITFWHIPFPNPEAFGICPWRVEILEGLLGSNILGFHTRFHCNNFLDTVDRFVESRVIRENSTVSYQGRLTVVNPYPISIESPSPWLGAQDSISDCRHAIRKENSLAMDMKVGIGVDRLDYTKGILERFLAVERLLETYPKWIGKFSFVQIAAPSRTNIEEYKNFQIKVEELADRINHRFGKTDYRPICLRIEHKEPDQIYRYYRGSDLCFVSSLHDGMNLVAKEFVASRADEEGVLVLSQFTGASREMLEALIVNPYNADQCALALHTALEMPKGEQRNRMRSMRGLIHEFNVYRWAGRMILDAARLRERTRLFGHTKGFTETMGGA